MSRFAIPLISTLYTMALFAQVDSVGEVSFAVPEGWTTKRGSDHVAVQKTLGQNFWLMAVYTPMPSTGNSSNDIQAAWQRTVLAGKDYRGMPAQPYYDIRGTLGYPGLRAEDTNVNRSTITRLYVLETGRGFIPVIAMSRNRIMLDSMEHIAMAFIGSVRQAPQQAQPVQSTLNVGDLVGKWRSGAATSRDTYDPQTGQYRSSSTSFYAAAYTIAADGGFTYQLSGKSNGSTVREQETGVVELGGGFVTFKGKSHLRRSYFIRYQHGLDGAAVLTLLPDNMEVTASNIILYAEHWTHVAK